MLDEIFARYPQVAVKWDTDWNEYRATVGDGERGMFGSWLVYGYADTPAEALRSADERARNNHVKSPCK